MKKIPVGEIPRTIFGKPFRIGDYDAPPLSPEEIREGKQPAMIEEADIHQLLTLMVYAIPRDKLTMRDSIEANRFIHQLRESTDGAITLEDEEHKWIKEMLEKHGTSIYGVNTSVIVDWLDTFERLHQPKDETKKPE